MTTTDDSSTAQKSRTGAYVAYGLLALVLYFLSFGPAYWLATNDYMHWDIYISIYSPIGCIGNNTFVGESLFWYMELWRGY